MRNLLGGEVDLQPQDIEMRLAILGGLGTKTIHVSPLH